MRVAVWDTYVGREDGITMHFDILVPFETPSENVFEYGRNYLDGKAFKTNGLDSKACTFCHMEQATQPIVNAIEANGFYIIEMENCT
ncbi:uncharacterized protein DUF2024 [Ulvibacter sp. MAR_2010_11]|uniref:DUF2024 family protein n=1 Tax=Ulvibacter sp. MAR_2010_11 TaxID=1250229 RepID=UPI000C2BCA7E|nr:DUF2024 family protein [Ulvibacter sp. MAR_2010_11]PKA84393.1 uncharacterized protein DUF2024 [Ulvibacter sp. MAR_2010_11]